MEASEQRMLFFHFTLNFGFFLRYYFPNGAYEYWSYKNIQQFHTYCMHLCAFLVQLSHLNVTATFKHTLTFSIIFYLKLYYTRMFVSNPA